MDSGASRMRWYAIFGAVTAIGALCATLASADEVGDKIEAARSAYGHGDALRTLEALQAAEANLSGKLVDQFARTLPAPPAGWEATTADSQTLDSIGGGITVTRGFQKGEAALNASLLVDNPAVANILALFQPGNGAPAGDGGWRTVNIGGESALLRFDAANREGEIVMVIAGRAALQVEGSEIAADQVLIDLAQGWNLPAIKKLLGA